MTLQIGEVRQQLMEAHRRCSDQQATIAQLHGRLLSVYQELQVLFAERFSFYKCAQAKVHMMPELQIAS